MSIKKISLAGLEDWVDKIVSEQKVFGVQAKEDRFEFRDLMRATDLRLDYDVTILPPKMYFQPACETLLSFSPESGYQSVMDDEAFVLFGVHPYDMAAILQMDKIFSESEVDEHYVARRKAATLVVVDVQAESPNVFAGHMNTAVLDDGYDVLLTRVDEGYLAEARTEAGEALLAQAEGEDAGDADLKARREVRDTNRAALRQHDLKADPATWPDLLAGAMNHPVWEEKAAKCFSCGSCNLLCPTCYCFDVQEEAAWDLKSGARLRTWDGCMLTDFATVAGDHNFRKKREDRYRHRYYRKGAYVPTKLDGEISCVGCGRCITACVAKIANPVEIFNRLAEGQ